MTPNLADLIDRFSIESRKAYYGHGNAKLLKELQGQLKLELGASHVRVFGTTMIDTDKVWGIVKAAVLLGLHNADIANSEWQIRAGKQMPLEEVGRRALLTRRLNDDRSNVKQELSRVLGQNTETRHFGFGELDGSTLTLDVQEPTAKAG